MKTTETSASAQPVVDSGSPASRPQPKLGRWVALIAVLIVAGLAAGLLPRFKHEQELKKDTSELAIPTVSVTKAGPGQSLSEMLLPAEVRPYIEAPIYARASGYVTNWSVDIGAKVKFGQLMAIIDTPELDQELAAAKAGLAQAQAALHLAKVTADRWAELLKTASVSEQENAEKAADLQLKQANVDAAEAGVRRYQDLKAFCRVTAPFAGTVTARDIDVGDLISPGRELFRLSDTGTLRVFVQVPQSATPGVHVGGMADILIPEIPGRKFHAKIVRTAGAIDPASRTLLTELDLDNSKGEFIAGSYAQVSFHDPDPSMALMLPANTLLFRAEGPQVGVVLPNGAVQLRSITIGRDLGADMEILSGITATDQVIINPSDALVSGTQVRVAETQPQKTAAK